MDFRNGLKHVQAMGYNGKCIVFVLNKNFIKKSILAQKIYRIVASTNTCYYSENQLFVNRSQYIRTENPLHKQSEKAKTCH